MLSSQAIPCEECWASPRSCIQCPLLGCKGSLGVLNVCIKSWKTLGSDGGVACQVEVPMGLF